MAKSTRSSGGAAKKSSKASGKPSKPATKPAPKRKEPAAKSTKKAPAPAPKARKPAPVRAKSATPPAAVKHEPKAARPAAEAKAPAKAAAAAPPAADPAAGKRPPGKSNITVVQPRPVRRPKVSPKIEIPYSEPLLKPGAKWKPLIPSGPKAAGLGAGVESLPEGSPVPKTKLNKKDLDRYRQMLLMKRAELIGDVANMEDEALRQNSGALSSLPQHMAEQGSETYDQALSLDLAQVDRNLIREIDDALRRIDAGTYGVCQLTGKMISPDRLNELPWAKYSIEAARQLERRPYAE